MKDEIKRLQKVIGKKDKHINNQREKINRQEEIIKEAEDTIKKLNEEIQLLKFHTLKIPSVLSDDEVVKMIQTIQGIKPQLMVDDVVQSITREVTIGFDKLVQYEVEIAKSNFFQEIIKEMIRVVAR